MLLFLHFMGVKTKEKQVKSHSRAGPLHGIILGVRVALNLKIHNYKFTIYKVKNWPQRTLKETRVTYFTYANNNKQFPFV